MNPQHSFLRLLLSLSFLALLLAACSHEPETEAETKQPLGPKLDKLKLPDGFQAEHLYSPSEHEQGSWVSMTFDNRGRLITADQYGSLYRLDLPAIGDTATQPQIEKLVIAPPEEVANDSTIRMGYAQGLLYAFNSLYVMVNHESDEDFDKNTGLYRLQDTNGDDQFDKITLIRLLTGQQGEHGPHSIVMAPDQQSLYVIAGNHTDVPEMDAYRLPPVWEDDNIFPKILDPRGHANERAAPGGWIARIDSLGEHWELISAGFRNPFDLAFNEAGDMFTYDSDMEWDLGMPWYRPTRICHVTSGSEFGWRTGNGKWSPAYPDNLPGILNIGQGSPTNVLYASQARFPERYRRSLLAFDWSFGIIYAVHLEPEGASYRTEREEFISGMPLPLTDGVIGPDGALYFMTGGRKLDSDLYRVSYDGGEEEVDFALAAYEEPEETEAHKTRVMLEQYHGEPQRGAIEAAWPHLKSEDRFVRYAARLAIEHQPLREWQERVYTESDPAILIQGMVALARHADPSQRDQALNTLLGIDYEGLSPQQQVDLLRAFELSLSRLGKPGGALSRQVTDYLSPHYPASSDVLNQSLSKVLAALDAPQLIEKTLTLLETEEDQRASATTDNATNASDLILRNPQYGMDIAQMLKDVPPAQHTYYATVLSEPLSGWTPALRERYFRWFYRAFDFKGGNSYVGFIDKAREAALAHVPKDQFDHYNELSGDSLIANNGKNLADVPEPEGPHRQWELEEAVGVLDSGGLEHRSFEVGKNMYAAARCATCHSMQGEGGIIGPNLTQLGTRFSAEDMITAIVKPDEAISDQYASTVFYLENGQTLVGRLNKQDEEKYYVSQNPFAPDVIREVPKAEVSETKRATVSMMPPNLINPLNENELRDLIAYLMAGGDPDSPIYQDDERQAEK